MIKLNNISKSFELRKKQSIDVLSGINLDIPPGNIIGLIRLNGAGKTTLIKLIAELLKPSNGSIIYDFDMILSVGYRVKSSRGVQFRIWANRILKDYILKGYAVNSIFIDNIVYFIGASLKDLGKKLFSFSKMEMDSHDI